MHDTTTPETVVTTELDNGILTITINRPKAFNAVNAEVARTIAQAMITADNDAEIRCVILTGAGDKVFTAGADLKALAAGDDVVPQEAPYREYGFGGCTERSTTKPVIVAANGSAYGGGVEMMLNADIVIGERGREYALPEVTRGIFAAAGGVYRLPQALPQTVALDLLLTGEAIPAERAFELGFLSRLVEPGNARVEARRIAEKIVANAPLAVLATKRLARGENGGFTKAQATKQQQSDAEFAMILGTEDAAEGPRAFAEKRPPRYIGK